MSELVRQHGFRFQQYLDNTYQHPMTIKMGLCLDKIGLCVENTWLKLNRSKAEVVLMTEFKLNPNSWQVCGGGSWKLEGVVAAT